MSKKDNVEKLFLTDVAEHEMIIIRDDGVNRHIRFKSPGTSIAYFDLITWPGCLCYTGDMGTYVFQRLNDMFEFFREKKINPQYWGEKLEAVDRNGGFKEYSHDEFCRVVKDMVESHILDNELPDAEAKELRDAVESEVLSCDESEYCARQAARDFEHEGFEFGELWEESLTDYSHHFLVCCYALVWAIKKYDDRKAVVTA